MNIINILKERTSRAARQHGRGPTAPLVSGAATAPAGAAAGAGGRGSERAPRCRRRRRHECSRPLLTLLALVAALPASSSADVIFRVPEVMVRHTAAPRAVGTGPANRSAPPGGGGSGAVGGLRGGSDEGASGRDLLRVTYEEYFVEHDIPTAQARKAAQELNLNDEEARERRLSGCGTCSRRETEYCETRVLADHCCCERRFLRDPFPWIPHTCYLGPRRCRPIAGNCEHYTRLRDCCCYDKLAKRWKGILSSGGRVQTAGSAPLSLLLLAAVSVWLRT